MFLFNQSSYLNYQLYVEEELRLIVFRLDYNNLKCNCRQLGRFMKYSFQSFSIFFVNRQQLERLPRRVDRMTEAQVNVPAQPTFSRGTFSNPPSQSNNVSQAPGQETSMTKFSLPLDVEVASDPSIAQEKTSQSVTEKSKFLLEK